MSKTWIVMCAACCLSAAAQTPQLRFADDGTFKIVQFTDTHLKWGNDKSQTAYDCVDYVLQTEQPQLAIFTGDQVYGPGVEQSMDSLLRVVERHGVPYAIIFGNHDHQFDMTLPAIYDLAQGRELSVMPPRPGDDNFDYVIDIQGSDGKDAYAVYCMYTHDHNPYGKGYDGLYASQVDWYREQSDARGHRPALLMLHIPLPEYQTAIDYKAPMTGVKKEKICCSALNAGMFLTLRDRGDIKGVFCGHDHDNDFVTDFLGVKLAYGRYSGGKTVYNHLRPGARVILLNENDPSTIETWITELP